MINICDTKTFKTISDVAAKVVPDQIKCTHEMGFEFTVNQRLLTKFLIDFPNLLISTTKNNKKIWEESQLLKTVPSLTTILTPIRAPSQMPHGKIKNKPTHSPSNKPYWLSSFLSSANTNRETFTEP